MREELGNAAPMDESDVYHPHVFGKSAIPTETAPKPAQDEPSGRQLLSHWLARALPVVSALMLVVATWLPWMTLRSAFGPGAAPIIDFPISGSNGLRIALSQSGLFAVYSSSRWVSLLWNIAPLFGLLIGLFHLRLRQLSRTLVVLYGAWLVVMTAITLPVIIGLLTTLAPLSCGQTCSPMPVLSRMPQSGIWLAIGGLLLGWITFGGSLVLRRSAGATAGAMAIAHFSRLRLVGASVLTLGATIWALGLFVVPWATSGCTGLHLSLNHFVRGACSGVDGWDVFNAGIGSNVWLALLFLEIVPVVGLYVAIDIWLPRLSRSTWALTACWSLLLTFLFILGVNGVRATIMNPPRFAYGLPGAWAPSFGVAICAIGIALGWVGVVLLSRAEFARVRAAHG